MSLDLRYPEKAIFLTSTILIIWVVFFNNFKFYWAMSLCLAFITSLTVCLIVFKKSFKFEDRSLNLEANNPINLIGPMSLVCLIAALMTSLRYQVVASSTLYLYVLIIFSILLPSTYFVFRKNTVRVGGKKSDKCLFLFLLLLYSYCLVMHINAIGPVSADALYKGVITKKNKSYGYRTPTTRSFDIEINKKILIT